MAVAKTTRKTTRKKRVSAYKRTKRNETKLLREVFTVMKHIHVAKLTPEGRRASMRDLRTSVISELERGTSLNATQCRERANVMLKVVGREVTASMSTAEKKR
ncbi:MAG: hypothetical protein HOE11_02800 [Candidatus Diapherotrites archaeon]|nr:hypothetical protein [Candidatus Diapherotrites archaeon]MBT4596760.1 hypothetical protein [Candidatus Diapherotrites archaeon]